MSMTDVDHYIKPLRATNIPKSRIVLAAASVLGGDKSGYRQSWRCASVYMRQESTEGGARERRFFTGEQERLWNIVHEWCNRGGMTFLWVHDLQWTARVTDMLTHLTSRGWRLDAFALNPGSSWMVWRRGRATVKVSDVMSVWPTSISQLGTWFGPGSRTAPFAESSWQVWQAAATRDRDILVRAVESYMQWIKDNELGTLAVTGNSQASKAFRRRFLVGPIVAHHDNELLAMERRAMWTGRCEAYWRGSTLREVVDEWDFTMAHNHIAATEPVPVFPHRPLGAGEDLREWIDKPGYAVLAEVDIETDEPYAPASVGPGIAWPTGRFRSTLWSPELRVALDAGGVTRVRHARIYRADMALRGWADWVGDHMAAEDSMVPAWQKDILKRWSNTLIGWFGMRYPKWRKVGTSETSAVSAATLVGQDNEETGLIIQIGRDVWEQAGWTYPRNRAPMVTGYVMSAMRARLWRLMKAMPPNALLYVDTDSVLVSDAYRRQMSRLARDPEFEGLRLKRSWDGLSIYGPRQLVTGEAVRVSGLPKTASRLGRTEFEGEVVEGLLESLRASDPGGVRITPRQWKITGEDTRRQGSAFGWTEPFHVNDI